VTRARTFVVGQARALSAATPASRTISGITERWQRLVPHAVIWGVILLFPALSRVSGGVATVQKILHVAVLAGVAGLYVLLRPASRAGAPLRTAVLYCCVVTVYYITCTLFLSNEIMVGDLPDLVRPFVYLIYFSVPLLFQIDGAQLAVVFRALRTIALISVAFSALVYVPAAWPLVDLYKGRPSDDEVVMHFFRWSGTFGYPSDFSFFLSFFIYFQVIDWIRYRVIRKADVGAFLVIFVGLLMTLSRGGILTVVAMTGLVVTILGLRWAPRVVAGAGLALAVLILVIAGSWATIQKSSSDQANFAYVGAMFAGSKMDRSTVHRVKEAQLAVDEALRRFPVGAGPNREYWKEQIRVIESLYGHLLLKWGVIGLLLYGASVVWIVSACASVYRAYRADRFIPIFALAVAVTVISVPLVFGLSSAMSDRFKVLGFYHLLAGYAVALWGQTRALHHYGTLQRHVSSSPHTSVSCSSG
jgi:hypothetical protein